MEEVFASRKESFINSLEKAIATISSDRYVQQMFQDQYSANYVPDRICELIRQVLLSDREDEINMLYNRIRGIEFFFDEDKIKQIENLGKKYTATNNSPSRNNTWNGPNNQSFNNFTYNFSDVADYDGQHSLMQNAPNSNQPQNFKKEDVIAFCKILNQQIKSLDKGNLIYDKSAQIPRICKDLKKSITEFKNAVISTRNEFSSLLKRTKNHTLRIYQISTEKVKQEYVQRVKNAKLFISQQNEQIKQLSESASNMYDANTVSVLEENLQKLKNKLSKSKENISSLQEQLSLEKNANEKLENKINMLSHENHQITEEVNRLNGFLDEKQQRIDFLEQSMSKIENEILEPDQMNKIQEKMLNLNDTIKKIQTEKDNLLKKSDTNEKIISNLMNVTNTAKESDLVSKIDRLYQEKVKVCQLLNRSIHSDTSKAVEMIYQTHEALKSIMDISDDSKLVSEIQNLKDQKKSLRKASEKESTINEITKILDIESDNESDSEIRAKVQSFQRLKNAFEKLCLDCNIKLDNDLNSFNYNLPKTVVAFQKSFQSIKEVMTILGLKSYDQIKENLLNLVDVKKKTSQLCEVFRLSNEIGNNGSQLLPASRLLKVAKNLVKVKESYDTIVSSLNSSIIAFNKNDSFLLLDFESFDESNAKKARLNARSFILMKSSLKTLCELLKIDFKLPIKKILAILVNKVKSLAKSNENYLKVLDLLEIKEEENDETGILMVDKAIQIIRSLLHSRKNSEKIENLIDENENVKRNLSLNQRQKKVESLINTRDKYKEVCEVLSVPKSSPSKETNFYPDVSNEVSEIWSILRDLCLIFKLNTPELHSMVSLSSAHKSLCSIAKSLQESHSKNLSSVYNIGIRLKHFKQVLNSLKRGKNMNDKMDDDVNDDLRCIENEIIQIMNDLSNIFVCFGTSDYNEIKLAKLNFDLQKKEIQRLFQITGKESIEESLEFLSKHFINIRQSSSFLSQLFRVLQLLPGSPNSPKNERELTFNRSQLYENSNSPVLSSVDGVPLPIPRAAQERLLSSAGQRNIEKAKLKSFCDKIIDKAKSFGFSGFDNRRMGGFNSQYDGFNETAYFEADGDGFLSSVDSAFKFIIETSKREAEAKLESQRNFLQKRLTDSNEDLQTSMMEYRNKIDELTQAIASITSKNEEKEKLQFLELQSLRKKLDEAKNMLDNEKKLRAELINAIGSRETLDQDLIRSRMSANEIRLLSQAEQTRKVVDEMRKKKEDSQSFSRFKKMKNEEFQTNGF